MANPSGQKRVRHVNQPCLSCGVAPKEPGMGKKFCLSCREEKRDRWLGTRRAKEAQVAAAERGPLPSTRQMVKDAPPGFDYCSRCKRYRPPALMLKNGSRRWCRDCNSLYLLDYRLRNIYNITVDQYEMLLQAQGNSCAICGVKPRKMRLAVDHDHKCCAGPTSCGKCIRGLLCKNCNRGLLGHVRDDPGLLRAAIEYLEHPHAQEVLALDTGPVADCG